MGNKYTVTAGIGNKDVEYHGTEWLVVALWKLYWIKVDKKEVYWKQLLIN